MKHGQSQVLSAVLLGGILIAGISAAYIWGLPILEKNQDVNQVETTLQNMKTVSDGISTVAQEGGSRSVSLELGDGSVDVNVENDTITYRTVTKGAYVSMNDWVPLNENDVQGVPEAGFGDSYGIRGVDKPGVLIGRSEQQGDEYFTTYKIVFRDLKDPSSTRTRRIDLVENGNLQASGGTRDIVFQQYREETVPGEGVDGGTLQKMQVLVRVS